MQIRHKEPLIYLRWALIAALAYLVLSNPESQSAVHLGFVAILLASNVALPRVLDRISPQAAFVTVIALDSVLVLTGLALCGAASQDLLIGYFLCICMASFADSEGRLAGAALLTSGVYGLWLFRDGVVLEPAELLKVPFLFVTTIFYGYMMQRLRQEEEGRERAEARAESLNCLLQVTRRFSSSLVMTDVFERVTGTIQRAMDVDECWVQLLDGEPGSIHPVCDEALRTRTPVTESVRRDDSNDRAATLAVPIVHGVETLGVLTLERHGAERSFRRDEIDFAQVIANSAAGAIRNAQQHERVLAMEQARSEFLSNLSHEIRTPLHAILGYSDLASDLAKDVEDTEMYDYLQRINANVSEMQDHVDNLLQLSQISLGRERKEISTVDVAAVLGHVLERAKRVAPPGEIDFALDLDPAVGEIYTDRDKLERVVQAVLMNAVKFTNEGEIRLTASILEPNGNESLVPTGVSPWERILSLSIRDTGVGIEETKLQSIFQDFRKGDASSTSPYRGLGLGLAVSKRLVELMGGAIRVESAPGEGSTFRIFLPVQTVEPTEVAA